MDLHEDKDKNLVTATFELPGLKKNDVSNDINENRPTICAESKLSSERDEKGYAIREMQYGRLSSTVQIPPGLKVGYLTLNAECLVRQGGFGLTHLMECRRMKS